MLLNLDAWAFKLDSKKHISKYLKKPSLKHINFILGGKISLEKLNSDLEKKQEQDLDYVFKFF